MSEAGRGRMFEEALDVLLWVNQQHGMFTAAEFAEGVGIGKKTSQRRLISLQRRGMVKVVSRLPGRGNPLIWEVTR